MMFVAFWAKYLQKSPEDLVAIETHFHNLRELLTILYTLQWWDLERK